MVAVDVSGYVLAGGKSSRMGQDKALLKLAGRPLVELAVATLQKVCGTVQILSNRQDLASFGLLVPDLHPGCGPLGGMEAALQQSTSPWSLFLAVDMPFVPASFLQRWVREVMALPEARVALFTVDGLAQPTLCMVHQELSPSIQSAVERGEYRVFSVLDGGAKELAQERGWAFDWVFLNKTDVDESWFANLNTPEEFAQAELRWAATERGQKTGAS